MEQAPKLDRVEKWLQLSFPELSRRQVREAIEGKLATVGGQSVKKGNKVPKDALDVAPLLAHLTRLKQGTPGLNLEILHESDDFVVVDKSPGIHCHPISLWDTKTVSHWALDRYPLLRAEMLSRVQPTLTPHRLDVGTSGALIVAKTGAAYELWRERFANHRVEKRYLAWCWGKPPKDRFEVAVPIGHDPTDASKMQVPSQSGHIRPPILEAHTEIQVLARRPTHFLCEAETRTGVTHQIRVHLAHAGFPLLGDTHYDASHENRPLQPDWPQLRAVELRYKNFCLPTPRERFITSF